MHFIHLFAFNKTLNIIGLQRHILVQLCFCSFPMSKCSANPVMHFLLLWGGSPKHSIPLFLLQPPEVNVRTNSGPAVRQFAPPCFKRFWPAANSGWLKSGRGAVVCLGLTATSSRLLWWSLTDRPLSCCCSCPTPWLLRSRDGMNQSWSSSSSISWKQRSKNSCSSSSSSTWEPDKDGRGGDEGVAREKRR